MIEELDTLSTDGIYSMAKIEWWLLKYSDEYNRIEDEESKRFMYFIDGRYIRLPDYFDARTPNEKFLHIYGVLDTVSNFHKHENYFKQEMAIYKGIKNEPERVREWLLKNEYLGAEKYFMFSMDYFGDEDEMENYIHLKPFFLNDRDRQLFIDREDFINTIEFTNIFYNIYWCLLEELKLDKLN